MAAWQIWASGVGHAELTYGRLAAAVALGASGVLVDSVEALARYTEAGLHQERLSRTLDGDLGQLATVLLGELAGEVQRVVAQAGGGRPVQVALAVPPGADADQLVEAALALIGRGKGAPLIGLMATAEGSLAAVRLLEQGHSVLLRGLASAGDLSRMMDGAAAAIRRADPGARPEVLALTPGVWRGVRLVVERLEKIGEPVDGLAIATLRALLAPYLDNFRQLRQKWAAEPELAGVRPILVLEDAEGQLAAASWWQGAAGWHDDLVLAPSISRLEEVRQALALEQPDELIASGEELSTALLGRDLKLAELTSLPTPHWRRETWHRMLARWRADQQSEGSAEAGPLAVAVAEAHHALAEQQVLKRIATRDASLFTAGPLAGQGSGQLDWVDLPISMRHHLGTIERLRVAVWRDGFTHLLVLGSATDSLGARLFSEAFGTAPNGLTASLLDAPWPSVVRRLATRMPGGRTLVLVLCKSGAEATVQDLLAYFKPWLERHLGQQWPAACVAITDPKTPLAIDAKADGWRWVGVTDPELSAPYGVLGLAGLVPLALLGHDPRIVLQEAGAVRDTLSWGGEGGVLELTALLVAAVREGRNKLTFYADPAYRSLPRYLARLISAAAGPLGAALVPVVGEELRQGYGQDRLFVSFAGQDPLPLEQLAGGGHPIARFGLGRPAELGREVMRWQAAVAAANWQLAGDCGGGQVGATPPAARPRPGLSPEEGALEIEQQFHSTPRPSFLQVSAYLDGDGTDGELCAEIRHWLGGLTMAPVSWRYGPAAGQSDAPECSLPTGAVAVQLVERVPEEAIPGRTDGFGAHLAAEVAAERAALEATGCRVVTVELGESADRGLRRLLGSIAGGRR